MDSKHKPLPKWTERLFELIYEHWHYHSPCKHIDIQAFVDEETKIWQVIAAPVYQEVFGGDEDGKKVWSGFSFDVDSFVREHGVWMEGFMLSSYCQKCTKQPELMASGKFRGHQIYLSILLEPIAETNPVEVIDTLGKKIRDMPEK